MSKLTARTTSFLELFSTLHPQLDDLEQVEATFAVWDTLTHPVQNSFSNRFTKRSRAKSTKTENSFGQPFTFATRLFGLSRGNNLKNGQKNHSPDHSNPAHNHAPGVSDHGSLALSELRAADWSAFWTEFEKIWQSPAPSADEVRAKQQVRTFFDEIQHNQAKTALNHYILALKSNDCSAATLRNYRSDINQFFDFGDSTELATLITKPKIQAFLDHELEKGLSPASIRRKRSSLSLFATWLSQTGWLALDGQVINEFSTLNPRGEVLLSASSAGSSTHQDSAASSASREASQTKLGALGITIRQIPQASHPQRNQNANPSTGTHQSNPNKGQLNSRKSPVWFHQYLSLLPVFNIGLLVVFLAGLTWFGYQQLKLEAPEVAAYPATLTRPSRVLSFQGRLTDTLQNPITAATPMAFRLYDVLSGPATPLWSSGSCSVTPDQDGIFSTGLGADCGAEIDSDVFSENAGVYLEVEINGETLSPRQPIRTVAYAINSETLQGYPPAEIATANTVLVLDSNGDLNLGATSPSIVSTDGTFTLEGQAIQFQTATGTDGDITLSPDGIGGVIVNSDLDVQGSVRLGAAGVNNVLNTSAAAGPATGPLYWGDSTLVTSDSLGTIAVTSVTNSDGTLTISPTTGAVVASLNLGNANTWTGLQTFSANAVTNQISAISAAGLGLYDDGGNGIFVEDGGNVGIGTTAPVGKLDVAGSIIANSGGHVEFRDNLQVNGYIDSIYSGVNGGLTFYGRPGGNLAEIMRIHTNGSVGIGTTDPSQKLDVAGAVRLGAAGGTNDVLNTTAAGGAASGPLYWGDEQIAYLSDISGGGAVTSVSAGDSTLTISPTTGAVVASLNLGNANTWTGLQTFSANAATNQLSAISAAGLGLYDDGGNGIFVEDGGNVGIGTTNPTYKLHLASGEFRNVGTMRTGTTGEPGRWRFYDASGYLMSFWDTGTDWDTWGMYWNTTDNQVQWMGGNSLRSFVDLDNGTGYFQGSLGLGTTSPAQKLDVTGAIRLGAAGAGNVLNTSSGSAPTGPLYWGNQQLAYVSGVVTSVSGTTNQITASPTTGAVVLSLPTDLRAPGVFNAVTSIATGAGAGTVRINSSGNLTNIGTIGSTYLTTSTNVVNLVGASTALQMNGVETITSGRLSRLANGSAATPAFSFSGDSNTGLFSATTDELGFSTAGTEQIRIDNVGNVGVGTTNPLVKLQVGQDTVAQPFSLGALTPEVVIVGDANNTTEDSLLRLVRPTNVGSLYPAAVDFKVKSYGTLGSPFSPKTQLTLGLKAAGNYDTGTTVDVLTLRDDGTVGIGTTAPAYKLDVNGDVNVNGDIRIPRGADVLYAGAPISTPPEENLSLHYSFDEASGTRATDNSGSGNSGTITGTTSTAGVVGNARNFGTAGDFVVLDTPFQTSGQATFSFWYKRVAGSTWKAVANRPANNIHHIMIDSAFNIGYWNSGFSSAGYTVPNDGQYHHYTVVINNNSTYTLYVDGKYHNQIAFNIDTTTYPITHIGGGQNYYVGGPLDEFKIFNEALTEAEINAMYLYPQGARTVVNSRLLDGDLIVDSSGKVGIGTTAPSQKLDVAGAVRLGAAGGTNDILNTTAAGGAASGPLYWGNSPLLTSADLGSYGVTSVTAGNSTLTISPTTGAVVASLNLNNANNWTAAQTFSANAATNQISAISAAGLGLYDDGGNGIFVKDGGNVGIGTTDPSQKLDVAGAVRLGAAGGANDILNTTAAGGAASGALYWGDEQIAYLSDISGGGAVTSVSAGDSTLTISPTTGAVVASLNLGNANTWTGLQTFSANAATNQLSAISAAGLGLYDDGGNGIFVKDGGNVGIGTTNPTARLNIAAGTTTNAPLKLTSGTNLTTAQTGAFEYDGSELYFTPTGTTRETIAYISDITGSTHDPVTLGVIGSTPNANGMTLTNQVLNLEPASASFGGVITTGAQTLAGAKTLTGLLTTAGISNATTAITNSAGYTQTGTAANTFTGTSTFSNATYSALFTGGNVGIGTTAPDYALQVHTATGQSDLAITTNDDLGLGNSTQLSFVSDYDGTPAYSAIGQQSTGDLKFSASGNLVTPDLTLLSSNGNLGIGTTAPSQKLDVAGAVRLGAAGGTNDILNTSAAGGAATGNLYWGNATVISSANISSYAATSVTGTANQITASPTTGAVVLSLPSDLRAPGTFNATTSIATGAGAGTVRIDASGNLTNIGTIASTYLSTGTDFVNLVGASTALQLNGVETITAGRLLRLADGSESTPAVSFTSDPNSGLFSAAADELGLSTAGTEKIRIDASGNVGIGTTAPAAKLDIAGASSTITNASGDITINAASGSISFAGDSITNFGAATGADGSVSAPTFSFTSSTNTGMFYGGSNSVAFATNGSQQMTIDSSGNVSIGTTSVNAKLTIAGGIRAAGEITSDLTGGYSQFRAVQGNYGFMVRNDGTDTNFLLTAAADQYGNYNTLRPLTINNGTGDADLGQRLFVNHLNNVSIGSDMTGAQLIVNQINSYSNDIIKGYDHGTQRFRVGIDGYTYAQRFADLANSNFYLDPAATGDYSLYIAGNIGLDGGGTIKTTNNNDLIIDTGTGKVGIGTTAPDYTLVIQDFQDNSTSPVFTKDAILSINSGTKNFSRLFLERVNDGSGGTKTTGGFELSIGSGADLYIKSINSGVYSIVDESNGYWGFNVIAPGYLIDLPNVATTDGRGRANAWTTYSSMRWKHDITPIANALDIVEQLRPVSYIWNPEHGGSYDIGFVAEEVGAIMPYLVDWEEDGSGYAKGLAYDRLTAINMQAIKELSGQFEQMKAELTDQGQGLLTISEIGSLEIIGSTGTDGITAYSLEQSDTLIESLAAFAQVVTARIEAGLVSTREIVASRFVRTPELQTDRLTATSEKLQIKLADGQNSALEIIDSRSQRVASIDQAGNATFSGGLTAGTSQLGSLITNQATVSGNLTAGSIDTTSARIQQLEGRLAYLEEIKATTAEFVNATVSGTLFADSINNFDQKVELALEQSSLLNTLLSQEDSPSDTNSVQPVYQVLEAAGFEASGAAELNFTLEQIAVAETDFVINPAAVFVDEYLRVNGNSYVGGALGIQQKVLVGDGLTLSSGAIAYQSTTSRTLYLQPAGGQLDLVAGLMTLDSETGQVSIAGDLAIAGKLTVEDTLLSDLIQPTDFTNPLQIKLATQAASLADITVQAATTGGELTAPATTSTPEVKRSRFEIIDELGTPVATISADGRASFKSGLEIGQAEEATSAAQPIVTSKTAGVATVEAGRASVLIRSDKVTENSLIYVTPLASTNNQVLYVKGKVADDPATLEVSEGAFEIGFQYPASNDIKFNWWIVN